MWKYEQTEKVNAKCSFEALEDLTFECKMYENAFLL